MQGKLSSRYLFLLFTITSLLSNIVLLNTASARMKVNLGDFQFKSYRIAIPDFKNEGMLSPKLSRKIAAVLRNDLELTGSFKVLPPAGYLERPPKNGIEPGSFDFKPWITISAQGLLKGSYKDDGRTLLIKFRFYQIGTNKLALKENFKITQRKSLRWYLHLFSEKLYKFLTQEKGIFTTQVAYIRNYRGKQEVWVMDFDGNHPRRITNNGSINALPAWSPNGKYIAYTSWKLRNPDLFLYNRYTGRSKKISKFRGLNTGAAWSPDSRRIAFSASRGKQSMNIYVMNADGSGVHAITHSKWGIRNLSPSWSPDGRKIAFVSTRFGNPQIFIMNADGSNVTRITFKGKYNQSPKWSPKGDWILFTGRDERNVFDLFLVSPKPPYTIKRLTQNQGNNMEATWSPNGRNIIFTSTRNGVAKLFIMTNEGKYPKQLTFLPGQYLTPTWSPWLNN